MVIRFRARMNAVSNADADDYDTFLAILVRTSRPEFSDIGQQLYQSWYNLNCISKKTQKLRLSRTQAGEGLWVLGVEGVQLRL